MGLLDDFFAGQAGASPWGALYQNPDPALADALARQQAEAARAQSAAAMMSGNPAADSGVAAPSVFGQVPQIAPQAPAPPASPFGPVPQGAAPSGLSGPGAAPFGFGGPSTMAPAMMARPPQAAPPPPPSAAPTPPVAGPAPAAPPIVAADDGPDSMVPVGKYQMPMFGEPGDAPDASAAGGPRGPAPGAGAPGGAPAPFSLAGAAGGFGDRLMKGTQGFIGNLHNGPIGAIAGGLGALVTGKSTDPGSIAREYANQTAQALIGKGASPADVAAAGNNPELLKALIAQYYGKDKYKVQQTGEDGGGRKTFQLFNESDGSLKPIPGNGSGAPDKYSVDPELTGPARLDALRKVDPLYARKIESMVAGDLPMPTGVAALRPDAKRMIEDALAVDGATSASDFQTRASTRKDYASGIASRVTKSINTTIGHFATLDDSIGKLGNYSYFPKITNTVHDLYSSNMDPKYQAAKATFETNKEAAVKELDFALSGGHSSVSGSAELRDKFNRADSPEALHAAISEAMSLLQKRLESHTKAFQEGTKSQRDPQDFIYPENRQAFGRMLGQPSGGAPGAAEPGAATVLPPGNYAWSPTSGIVGVK